MADTKRTASGRGPGRHGHGGHGFQRPKDMKGTFKKLMHYVGRYKGLLVLVAVCLIVSSVASVATSYMLKPLLNNYIIPGDFPGLFRMLLLMGGLFALSSLCSYAYARIMVHVAQNTVAALRQDLFDRLQELPIRYYDRHQSGDLMSRFTNDIDTVSEMLNSSFASIISNVLTFVGTVVMMLVLNPWLTLITFLFLGLMAVVVKTVGGRSRTSFQRQQAALGAMNGYIEEMIEGQKVIKVFNHEDEAITRFTDLNGGYRDAATAAQAYAGMMMPAMGNLSKINYAVTCCVGGLLAIGGVFDVGSLGAYLLYVKQVSQPVGQISQQINTLLAAAAGAERIFAVMEEQPETDEGKTVIVRVEKNGDTLTETAERTGHWAWKKPDGTLVELRGDVRFDHVSFSYDGEKTVLNDVSLFAKPGQKIAFVGSTGAGKTTITNLINRFYDVQQGTITYDGIDVKDIAKDSLRRSLGIVLQDTHLFTGTVADNIRYGKLDATDEEVRAAAKLANADAFIRHLPQGYDTVITGDGGSLSQGERQLLAIARAAVSDPPVLILDEATSSIDTRHLTRIIRESGVMNGAILTTFDPADPANAEKTEALLADIRAYAVTDAVKSVTCAKPEVYNEKGETHIVLMHYGCKRNIVRCLVKRGCKVTVMPAFATAEEVAALAPDGIMLSNGPGDPAEPVEVIENLKQIFELNIPTFGICLGHQLSALAAGAKTMKLKYGHRGANQPVTDFESGRTFITSQNHGYAVVGDELPAEMGEVAQVNANDGTCEGIKYKKWNCFTVQFHPEANGGPKDTEFLFDRFLNNVKAAKKEAR